MAISDPAIIFDRPDGRVTWCFGIRQYAEEWRGSIRRDGTPCSAVLVRQLNVNAATHAFYCLIVGSQRKREGAR